MKKLILGAVFLTAGLLSNETNAQIQKDNWMVGGQVANVRFTNGFNLTLTPQVGYFIKNNWAIGAEVGLSTGGGTTNWSVGAFTRYYFGKNEINSLLNNGRFFGQGNVGFGGINSNAGNSTNGANLGIGAGYAYFISRNVSLDALLKFNAVVGAGNTSGNGSLGMNIGFQIYLPTAKAKAALQDQQ